MSPWSITGRSVRNIQSIHTFSLLEKNKKHLRLNRQWKLQNSYRTIQVHVPFLSAYLTIFSTHLAGDTQLSVIQERALQALASQESPKNKCWSGMFGKIDVPAAAISNNAFTVQGPACPEGWSWISVAPTQNFFLSFERFTAGSWQLSFLCCCLISVQHFKFRFFIRRSENILKIFYCLNTETTCM